MMSINHPIILQNVGKIFKAGRRSIEALRTVSIKIEQGEIFCFLGPNGAGKTTLVKIILGLVIPSQGTCTILGNNSNNPESRKKIGYVPEVYDYPVHYTPIKALTFLGRLQGLKKSTVKTRIDEVLELVNMEKWHDVRIEKFSKGMKQRITLAQALLHKPDILILDEPTSGIDPVGRREMRDVLKRLHSLGVTIVCNSHLVSEVELISNRLAVMNKGEIIKIGSVAELTSRIDGYRIVANSQHIQTIPKSLASYKPEMKESSLIFHAADKKISNIIVKILNDENFTITEIKPMNESLEDVIVQLLSTK